MLSDRYRSSTKTEIDRLHKQVGDIAEKIEGLKAKTYPLLASIERLEETIQADDEARAEMTTEDVKAATEADSEEQPQHPTETETTKKEVE